MSNRRSHQRALNDAHRRAQRGPQPKARRLRFQQGPRQSFRERVRRNPKAVLEGELTVAVVGIIIVFFGSILTAGGWYSTYSGGSGYIVAGTHQATPEPVLGVIVFFVGAAVIVVGVVLALLCIGMYLRAKLARPRDA